MKRGGVLVVLSGGENTALEDEGFGRLVTDKLMSGWDVEIFTWCARGHPRWLSALIGTKEKLTLKVLNDPRILPLLFF